MARLTHRLARLKQHFQKLGGGVCRLCYGMPFVALHIMVEDDPKGPGVRETGERILTSDAEDRITDDLRCKGCGTKARDMTIVGIGPPPQGRRLRAT